jgi:hypothetical protein
MVGTKGMRPLLLALLAPMMAASAPLAAQTAGDDPKDIIAAQIRDQGFKCDEPQSATRDAQASRPDEAVWVLQCEDASYRVRLDPDMAAKVERLDGKQNTEH